MKVKDLIELLQQQDENAEICIKFRYKFYDKI